MDHARLFAFEADFVATLRCIPMAVRMKLDRSGIKLTLRQWSRFTLEDRHILLTSPCDMPHEVGLYRAKLVWLVALRSGEEAKALAEAPVALWEAAGAPPPVVADYARVIGVEPPTARAWTGLSELERFTLIKLTRDNHDNVNFLPAMVEFGLVQSPAREAAQTA
ncbi:MAG: nitrate reductase associated protein [Pseudomonadota bacterium]